jgi:aspartyl/asparaginyl beta-hydroxylase (cupin superfamily)
MLKRVRDSRPYLEQWIEKNGVENSDVARILEGFDLSLQDDREPVDEMQLPDFYVPGLTASAWWDKGQFPWVASIEKSFPQILGEFQSIGGVTADSAVEHPARLDDQGRWSAYYLYFVGRLYSDHARACPNTMKALGEVPGWNESGMVYFSILDPQTHVAAHSGFTNTHLRCHLGIDIPDGCRMRVGKEARPWQEGQVNVFDDSFQHEVWNESDLGRAVLLFDTWHPDLTEVEIQALRHLVGIWRKFMYMNLMTGSTAMDLI